MRVDATPTVAEWLAANAARFGDRPALSGIDEHGFVNHADLERIVGESGRALRDWGVGTADVVLVALPDGPMALATLLSVASVAAVLPVPAHEQPDEYVRILDEVSVAAIVMEDRPSSPLMALAAERGITLVTVTESEGAHPAEAHLTVDQPRSPAKGDAPKADDDALYILTSGTTAVPKIVALTHAALWLQLAGTKDLFGLTEADRSICLMPLTHLHGIVRASLSAIAAGGSVACAPGFDTRRVLDWVERVEPTYLTAAPAVQRKLLALVKAAPRQPTLSSLRRLGVGSDRTEPEELAELRSLLGIPVVQMYGMSETAPLIATIPLDPSDVPAGSVGRIEPAWQVVCVDTDGRPVTAGESGEIAVAGGIINRLVGRSQADSQRFDDAGRFLTGDIGRIDANGYLFVEGRVDGMINRGGQKVNPTVVEVAIAAHPAVRAAAAFAEPDPVLGSRVAVAVELEDGASASTDELLEHAGRHLRRYMVPERVLFTTTLPRNRMGKIVRAEVAKAMAAQSADPADAGPAVQVEPGALVADGDILVAVLAVFSAQLEDSDIDPDVGFFELGGDSLGSLNVLIEVEDRFGVSIPPATFERSASARALAAAITRARETVELEAEPVSGRLVEIREGDRSPPLVFAHGLSGSDFIGPLFSRLGLASGHPLRSLEADRDALEAGERDLETMSADYARLVAGEGAPSTVLVGHSLGAHVAFWTATSLVERGGDVPLVVVLDDDVDLTRRRFGIASQPLAVRSRAGLVRRAMERSPLVPAPLRVLLVRSEEDDAAYRSDATAGWSEIALGGVDIVRAPGNHHTLVRDGPIAAVDGHIVAALASLSSTSPETKAADDAQREVRTAGRVACAAGDLVGEIAAYRDAIAADGDQPSWVYENLGAALLQAGDEKAGLEALDEAVARDAWPLSVDLRLLDTWIARGDESRITASLERAQRVAADHASVHEQRGRLLYRADRVAEAETAARQGLEMAPEHLELHLLLGQVLVRQGRFDAATHVLEEAREQTPGLDLIVMPLARSLVHAGDPARAIDVIDSMPGLRTHPLALTIRGIALREAGRSDEALETLRRAAELGPGLAEPLYEESVTLERVGRRDEALDAARRAAERPDASAHMGRRANRLAGRRTDLLRGLMQRLPRRSSLGRR